MKRAACSVPAGSEAPAAGVSEGGPRCQTKTKWYFPQNTNAADAARRELPAHGVLHHHRRRVTPAHMTDRSPTVGTAQQR